MIHDTVHFLSLVWWHIEPPPPLTIRLTKMETSPIEFNFAQTVGHIPSLSYLKGKTGLLNARPDSKCLSASVSVTQFPLPNKQGWKKLAEWGAWWFSLTGGVASNLERNTLGSRLLAVHSCNIKTVIKPPINTGGPSASQLLMTEWGYSTFSFFSPLFFFFFLNPHIISFRGLRGHLLHIIA